MFDLWIRVSVSENGSVSLTVSFVSNMRCFNIVWNNIFPLLNTLYTKHAPNFNTPLWAVVYYWLLLWHVTLISKQAKSSKYSKVLVNNTLWMEIYWYDRNTSFVFNVIYITVIQCNLELLCAHLSSWMQKLPLIVQINACGCSAHRCSQMSSLRVTTA